jgi:hypothetical protein
MKQTGYAGIVLLIWLGLIIAGVYGWIMNIVEITRSEFALTGMMVARVIGVFVPPLGSVLGYL